MSLVAYPYVSTSPGALDAVYLRYLSDLSLHSNKEAQDGTAGSLGVDGLDTIGAAAEREHRD